MDWPWMPVAGWSPFIGRKWFGVVGFFSCMACPSDGQVELFLIFFLFVAKFSIDHLVYHNKFLPKIVWRMRYGK
jgi:hypothetical protein